MTVILSICSLGMYLPYWFLVRRNWFNQLTNEHHISLITPVVLFFLYSLVAFSFVPVHLFLSGFLLAFMQYIDLVITYVGLSLTLYLAFQVRLILNTYDQNKEISLVLTLFFHVWYLQYIMNKYTLD